MYTYVVVSESDRKDMIFETTEGLRKQEFLYPWSTKTQLNNELEQEGDGKKQQQV
jgi:hypothetical protein